MIVTGKSVARQHWVVVCRMPVVLRKRMTVEVEERIKHGS